MHIGPSPAVVRLMLGKPVARSSSSCSVQARRTSRPSRVPQARTLITVMSGSPSSYVQCGKRSLAVRSIGRTLRPATSTGSCEKSPRWRSVRISSAWPGQRIVFSRMFGTFSVSARLRRPSV